MVKRLGSKIKRVSLVLGMAYFTIAAYGDGSSIYVCVLMVLALGYWLYQEIRLAKLLKAIDSD